MLRFLNFKPILVCESRLDGNIDKETFQKPKKIAYPNYWTLVYTNVCGLISVQSPKWV